MQLPGLLGKERVCFLPRTLSRAAVTSRPAPLEAPLPSKWRLLVRPPSETAPRTPRVMTSLSPEAVPGAVTAGPWPPRPPVRVDSGGATASGFSANLAPPRLSVLTVHISAHVWLGLHPTPDHVAFRVPEDGASFLLPRLRVTLCPAPGHRPLRRSSEKTMTNVSPPGTDQPRGGGAVRGGVRPPKACPAPLAHQPGTPTALSSPCLSRSQWVQG